MGEFLDAEEDLSDSPKDYRPAIEIDYASSSGHSESVSLRRSTSDHSASIPQNGNGQVSPLTQRGKARRLGQKTKAKTKQFLGLTLPSFKDESSPTKLATRMVEQDPAFNPDQTLSNSPPNVKRTSIANVKDLAKDTVAATMHPVSTTRSALKGKAAKKIARAQRPFLTSEDDRELLQAHDDLATSTSHSVDDRSSLEAETNSLKEKRDRVEAIESHRESLRTAWAVGRHVDRVRVVNHNIPFPHRETFQTKDLGGHVTFHWGEYLGKVCGLRIYEMRPLKYNQLALYYTRGFTAQYIDDFDELPFDIETLSRTVERLIIASAPWQAYCIDLRQLYRWEDPRRTGAWFVVWIFLWQLQRIGAFLYAYIVFVILKERLYPSSIQHVRSSLDRAIDRAQKAYSWSEFVDKHGSRDWIEPLLEDVGPQLQLQLGDLTDFLEVLSNFYNWKRPKQTAASVFFYFCCFMVSMFADMEFCLRIVYFICIFMFFLCWPISSRCPKYRFLMDPFKWIYWDIPTHAELSLQVLEKRAYLQQMEVDHTISKKAGAWGRIEERSSAANPLSTDGHVESLDPAASDLVQEVFKFRVWDEGKPSNLLISRKSVSLRRMRTVAWVVHYQRLVELRKEEEKAATTSQAMTMGHARYSLCLECSSEDGGVTQRRFDVSHDQRDEIFNVIIGWSGLHWKSFRAANRYKGAKI